MSSTTSPHTACGGAVAAPVYDEFGVTIYNGDALDVLPTLPENHVDTVITDPPYHLTSGNAVYDLAKTGAGNPRVRRATKGGGFMGKAWDGGDVAFRPETWAAVLRVCKPGAYLLAFGGTRTWHRLACAIEDAGWEIRDTICWLYGQGFPKSLDISKAIDKANSAERSGTGTMVRGGGRSARSGGEFVGSRSIEAKKWKEVTLPATDSAREWSGWGTALKPAFEPIIVAMKPLDGTFAENAQRHGVAGLNIDGARIGTKPITQHGRNESHNNCMSGKNYAESPGRGWTGRFPANVIIDDDAAAMLDEQSGELPSGIAVNRNRPPGIPNQVYGQGWNHSGRDEGYRDSGGASRFFYTAKASRSDRGHGNDHPTVKPTDLLKYLCKLTATPTGGLILDPFAGSGTTLVAARELGRPCIGIELEESHCAICVKRLAQGVLFGAAKEAI